MKKENKLGYGLLSIGPLGLVVYYFVTIIFLAMFSGGGFSGNTSDVFSALTFACIFLAFIGCMICPFVFLVHLKRNSRISSEMRSRTAWMMFLFPTLFCNLYFFKYLLKQPSALFQNPPDGKQISKDLAATNSGQLVESPQRLTGWITFAPLLAYCSALIILITTWGIGNGFFMIIFVSLAILLGVVFAMIRLTRLVIHAYENERIPLKFRSLVLIALFFGAGLSAIGYFIFAKFYKD